MTFCLKRGFWLVGLIVTIKQVWTNVTKYGERASTITQEDVRILSGKNFPKLVLCSDSMHSKNKIQQYYPSINETLLENLYGFNLKSQDEDYWAMKLLNPRYKVSYSLVKFVTNKYSIKTPPSVQNNRIEYEDLEKINMTKFYQDTPPRYFLLKCRLEVSTK